MISLKSVYYYYYLRRKNHFEIGENINGIFLKNYFYHDRIKIQEKLIFFDSNENEKIIKKKYLLNKQKRSYSSHDRLVNSPGGGGGWPPFIPGDSLTNTDYGEPRKRRDKTSPISFISLNCPRYRKTISPRLVSTPIAGFLIKEIYEFSNSCPPIQFRKKIKKNFFFHG